MINSAIEWAQLALFALLVGGVCVLLVTVALVMGLGYLARALWELDFKWVVE
ncbi:MAG: hypothetical protein RL563_1104 [Pseudomonadota bacterium]|jgi:hypothetical protein